ncbi:MAG: 1-acyl-sn-glycerol-3-phosphate acyltransferase [Verrucomicrobia bacterium]|jgi:1-acyl-sn-glycerol-3-phosphate acyltransferase|nr:1-acyl-sn-glycerol-3-phosphate acyltransferase [Verrucomicrobiota bacterium]
MRFGYFLFWCAFRSLFRVLFRCRIYHAERVPINGPVLLAANHASFMDPPLIGASLDRETHYLARNTLFRFPVIKNIFNYINVIPVDRDGKSPKGLKVVANNLKEGKSVIIFPEGTRCHDGKLLTAKSGVGLLAIKSKAPIIPIRVFGTFESYGRHLKWPKPGRVQIKFGHPMNFKKLREEAQIANKDRTKQIYQEAADQIMAAIAQLTPNKDCHHFGN